LPTKDSSRKGIAAVFRKVVVHPGGGLTLVTEDKGEMFIGPSLNDIHIESSPLDGVKVKFAAVSPLTPPLIRKSI
jgi:hypothetical protein